MEHKLIMENWRKHLKEYDASDRGAFNTNNIASQRTTTDMLKASEEHLKYVGEVARPAVELWNRTGGELLFKIPGPGAEEYTLSDFTIDVVISLLGIKIAKIVGKSAGKLYGMMKMRKKTGSLRISEDDFQRIFYVYTLILKAKPNAMQKFIEGLAFLAAWSSEQVVGNAAADELKARAKQVQAGLDQVAKSIEKLN